MSPKIAVIGSGSWGTTLAILLARHDREVWLWARTAEETAEFNVLRENRRFLPGVPFPAALTVTDEAPAVLKDAAAVLLVSTAQRMRENISTLRDYFPPDALLLSCAKGLELGTLKRMSEVIKEELPATYHANIGSLSGPNLAREIAAGFPASSVVAMESGAKAKKAQHLLNTPTCRMYAHDDLIGVELAGALKNVIAIGAGATDEFKLGDNAKATYLTRGLAEITRVGTAAGANPLTFAGLAGLGDLLCTCASSHSRNHYVGVELAKGRSLEDIRANMTQIAEGVITVQAARELGAQYEVEMPITEKLYQVLYEGASMKRVVQEMMSRELKYELEGLRGRCRAGC